MKTVAYAMLTLGLFAALPVEANAAACARGAYRAGCVGPRGAVTTHHGYANPVRHCYWRAGVKVCR